MNYEESGKLRSSREEENGMNASRFLAKCYVSKIRSQVLPVPLASQPAELKVV